MPRPDFDALCVDDLKALIVQLVEENARLREEIARLKGLGPPRPPMEPSRLEEGGDDRVGGRREKRSAKGVARPRNGGRKGSVRTAELSIDEERVLRPAGLAAGCRFLGRKRYVVQDLRVCAHVTRYHRERYRAPSGALVVAPLPAGIVGHYGPQLVRFVLQQYYECNVTAPKLLDQLHSFGIKISLGGLNNLLTEGKAAFHAEKQAILRAGLASATAVTVDDTGARHRGRNHHTMHVGNRHFACFETSQSKSRCDFLKLLLAGGVFGYRVDEVAIGYWQGQALPQVAIAALGTAQPKVFGDEASWQEHLTGLGLSSAAHRQCASEGALWAALVAQGLVKGLVIVSDGAGQFAIGDHARCWVHAERQLQQLACATARQRALVERWRQRVWGLYRALKAYAKAGVVEPCARRRLRARFDRIFNPGRTGFAALDECLGRLFAAKEKLLRVLDRPDVPLHTNGSESDIRLRVQRRKISGGTRGEQGRRCLDSFVSIIKTLRKHRLTFWDYLGSRLGIEGPTVPGLDQLIRSATARPG